MNVVPCIISLVGNIMMSDKYQILFLNHDDDDDDDGECAKGGVQVKVNALSLSC